MSVIQGTGGGLGGAGAPGGALGSFFSHTINQSLRLDDGSGAKLTISSASPTATNRKKVAISCWVKRGVIGSGTYTVFHGSGSGLMMQFNSDNKMYLYDFAAGSGGWQITSDRLFRDGGAWMHIALILDSTQATDSDRAKLYINGDLQDMSSWAVGSGASRYPTLNTNFTWHTGTTMVIGSTGSTDDIAGYIAEFVSVDGQSSSISDFGETKDGVWIPKDVSGLTLGDAGFHLKFDNTSDIGNDSGSNNIDFTAANVAAHDVVDDSPTKNYCTMTILPSDYISQITFAEGNLKSQNSTVHKSTWATFAITSGKWYWEALSGGGNKFTIGLSDAKNASYEQDGGTNNIVGYTPSGSYAYGDAVGIYAGVLRKNGSTVVSSLGYATNDKMGIAFDADAGKVWFHRNGTWFNGSGTDSTTLDLNNHDTTVTTGKAYVPVFSLETPTTWIANFGQDGTFATGTGGGNNDGNGEGDFFYAVPSGFLALNSANLSDVTISPGQSSQADDYFNTILWSGNAASSRGITGLGFQPDWVWIKERTGTQKHQLLDAVRGRISGASSFARLASDGTNVEATPGSDLGLLSLDSDGFTLGSDNAYNGSSKTYVSWNWKAEGPTPTKTYKVVVDNDGANKYRFRNSADDATFATYAPTVTLQEGGTYVFDWSDDGTNGAVSAQGHPIRFSTTSDGTHGGGTKYTTGVVEDDSAYTTTITVAASAPTLYYYCANHSGMGGQINTNSTFGSTNFDGSLAATVSANTDAGLSILIYDAAGVSTGTIGHGLTAAPELIIAKARDSATNWFVQVPEFLANTHILNLETTARDFNPGYNHFNDTEPTASVFSFGGYLGGHSDLGANTDKIAYCIHSVEGYSKVGSYNGNANNYDGGQFVYTGFRPAFVMVKSRAVTSSWVVTDNKRAKAFNGGTARLYWDDTPAETAYNSNRNIELFSNGFMVHGNSASSLTNKINESAEYIYLAYSEAGGPPKFARAR